MEAASEFKSDVKRWARAYPELGTGPVPIEPCISPEYFEREREAIFRRLWLHVGRVEEIPAAGDYFARDIVAAKASVVVIRGNDGAIRAFHNMCSHRGNKMVWDEGGHCDRVLTCRFHRWSYGFDGSLQRVSDENQYHELDKATLGLTPVHVEVWEGFIFVNLAKRPRETLAEYLGEFGRGMQGWPFSAERACYSYRSEVQCNWKVSMAAFQESYHVPYVHYRSVPESPAGPDNPFARPIHVGFFPRHQTLSVYANPKVKMNAMDEVAFRYGPGMRQRGIVSGELPPGVNTARSPRWGFDMKTFFPNLLMMLWGNGMLVTHQFWPTAYNRTAYEVRVYMRKHATPGARFSQEYNRAVLRSALMEDLATLENIQPMLESRAKEHFIFQDNEIGLRYHLKVVDDCVREAS